MKTNYWGQQACIFLLGELLYHHNYYFYTRRTESFSESKESCSHASNDTLGTDWYQTWQKGLDFMSLLRNFTIHRSVPFSVLFAYFSNKQLIVLLTSVQQVIPGIVSKEVKTLLDITSPTTHLHPHPPPPPPPHLPRKINIFVVYLPVFMLPWIAMKRFR